MKKSIAILTLLAGAVGASAQGVQWGDYIGGWTVTVYAPQNNAAQQQMGNTVNDTPFGSTAYQGVPLGGSGNSSSSEGIYGNGNLWSISLYAAPGVGNNAGVAALEASDSAIVTSHMSAAGGIGNANAGNNGASSSGMWSVGSSTTENFTVANGSATVQLVAWYNPAGTWQAAQAAGDAYGFSSIETLATGGAAPSTPPTLGGNLASPQPSGDAAISSFSLIEAVPEPSTIALGVIGASSFLFRRRK